MKTISDEKLSYLVGKLLGRISGGEEKLGAALQAHLADTGNPHGVSLGQLTGGGGTALLNAVYPVGAVYISTSPESPAALFGGSWERLEGRFLVGAGADYPAGELGGASSHALTVEELPEHGHMFHIGQVDSIGDPFDKTRTAVKFSCQDAYSSGFRDASVLGKTGGNQSFSTLPPYMAVYMWRRTA